MSLVEAVEFDLLSVHLRHDEGEAVIVSVLIMLQEFALDLKLQVLIDGIFARLAILIELIRSVDDRDAAIGLEHTNIKPALAICGTEDLDDLSWELHVIDPLLLEDIIEGNVAAVRDEDEGLDEDEAAEELAMILHLLIEDVLEVVVLKDISFFHGNSRLQLVINGSNDCVFSRSSKEHISFIKGAVDIFDWLSIVDSMLVMIFFLISLVLWSLLIRCDSRHREVEISIARLSQGHCIACSALCEAHFELDYRVIDYRARDNLSQLLELILALLVSSRLLCDRQHVKVNLVIESL